MFDHTLNAPGTSLDEPPEKGSSGRVTRLAIIGSGDVAKIHAAAVGAIPEARVTMICAPSLAKAHAMAKPFDARAVLSIEEVASSDDVDGVLIATPSGTHAAVAVPLLSAGKHVLCEKPIEIDRLRIQQMIKAARSSKVILAGLFPRRWTPSAQAIRHAVTCGRFGRITFVSARIKWWRTQSYYTSSSWRGTWRLDGGGALMNQGIHAIDLLRWIGGPILEVTAFSDTLAHPGVEIEDTLAAAIRFESGALGVIQVATSCYPGIHFSMEVSGDRGTAISEDGRIKYWHFAEQLPGDERICGGAGGGGSSDPNAISCEGHREQIRDFCRAIRGESVELIGPVEAANAVAIIEAIYRSTKSGTSEKVVYFWENP